MQRPPGGGHNPREAQELETRFSALSAEISASLDTILARLQRAPGDEHAIAVARELVAAQQAVAHQMLLLAQRHVPAPAVAASQQRPLLQQQLAQLLPPGRPAATPSPHDGWHEPSAQQRFDPSPPHDAPQAEMPTLGDLLRRHLAAPQPAHAEFSHQPQPVTYSAPRPLRPHALELAPMTLPASNHVVWTAGEAIAQPQHYAAEQSPAQPAYVQPASHSAPALTAAVNATAGTGRAKPVLPSWAQPAGAGPRYGLWAGGALAATVILLGVMLSAGRHQEAPAATAGETRATQTQAAEQTEQEPASATVQARTAPEPEPAVPAQPPPTATAEEPGNVAHVAPSPRVQPPDPQRSSGSEPPQGALLPSAQSWMNENADAEPEPAPKAAAQAKQNPARPPAASPVTGTLQAPKPSVNAAVKAPEAKAPEPKTAAKKADVGPFKTAVVKAPQEALYAPVLVELKNADALMVVFKDLQSRHGVLSAKRAEVRPAAGPNNETWFAVLAVPAVPKAEAEALCRAMGAEGATLRCRVVKY